MDISETFDGTYYALLLSDFFFALIPVISRIHKEPSQRKKVNALQSYLI